MMQRMRMAVALALALVASCATPGRARPPGFVDASKVVPGLVVEMRYAGAHNFVGRPVHGYERPVCILTRQAAEALAGAQADLRAEGLGLKVYDCYRPRRAVADFMRWAADRSDSTTKAEFYPDVDKRDLFKEGYIAERSGHSRGSTMDLTIVDGQGRALDMGSPFDLFSPVSWPTSDKVSPGARANRDRLAAAMENHGFKPLEQEWWHFTLRDEPFPETYFDFPVR